MKCLAIGDAFIQVKHFDTVLRDDPLFEAYDHYSFLEDIGRLKARELVRSMETKGSLYHEIPEAVYDLIEDKDVVFIHMFPISGALIERAKRLKYIVTARGGVENIDVAKAKEAGIVILNCPTHNALAVAEYTIGMILAETRNIARAHKALSQGVWRERFDNSDAIPELSESVIGIVGLGTIGRLVANRASAFGSRILVHDPYVPDEQIRALGYRSASLDDLLAQADIVTLHGRAPAGAPPIIGQRELARMKPSAYLINTARAALIDMDALCEALMNKRIMGAAVDVFSAEPVPASSPILKLDNVTLSNHRGGDTLNSYIKAPRILIGQLKMLLETGSTHCRVV